MMVRLAAVRDELALAWQKVDEGATGEREGGSVFFHAPGFDAEPDTRLYRTGAFRASFYEVAEKPANPELDRLPANLWVKIPAPPRNPLSGCRQRDWGTSIWDSDRE